MVRRSSFPEGPARPGRWRDGAPPDVLGEATALLSTLGSSSPRTVLRGSRHAPLDRAMLTATKDAMHHGCPPGNTHIGLDAARAPGGPHGAVEPTKRESSPSAPRTPLP